MKAYQTGYINLLALLMLGSLGWLLLWLNQDSLQWYQRSLFARTTYVEMQAHLFQQYRQRYHQFCQQKPTALTFSETLTATSKQQTLIHYVDCVRETLFLTLPSQAFHRSLQGLINPTYQFNTAVLTEPDYNHKYAPNLWLINQSMTWQLDGTIYGIILVQDGQKLEITGTGNIVGSIISQREVSLAKEIHVSFDQAVVQKTAELFSYWRRADGGWHDF